MILAIILAFFAILAVAGIVWLLVVLFFKPGEEILYKPEVINLSSKYSNNYARCIETNIEFGKGNRPIVTLFPLDIKPKLLGKQQEIKLVLGRNKRIIIPPGDWSEEKTIAIYLPPNSTDFPSKLKETKLGEKLMELTEEINAENAEIESLLEGSKRKTQILERLGGGELSEEEINRLIDLYDESVKTIIEAKQLTKSPWTPPSA